MSRSVDSKLNIKGLLQASFGEDFAPPQVSRAFEAEEIKTYILDMVVELATMADEIKEAKLASLLRSVVWTHNLEALCPTELSDR